MADEIRFSITREQGDHEPKNFTLKVDDTPVRIGRAPGNNIIVESRGVSQYHSELRYTRLDGQASPCLCLRDLSMNGTGLKKPDGKGPEHLEKNVDTILEDGAQILVPMLLKVSQKQEDRAWLRVKFGGPGGKGDGSQQASSRRKSTAAQGNGRGAAAGTSEEDQEQARLKFVELILKTKEVSAGTTYEDAKKLLSHSPYWHAVDEATRKECLEIFVEHLGRDQVQKKKDKKKGKEKDKDKSKKKNREETNDGKEQFTGGREEKKRRDRRGGGGSRSASGERKRKRDKKGSRRSRSRQGRSASPGGSPPRDKRRRRDRSPGSP